MTARHLPCFDGLAKDEGLRQSCPARFWDISFGWLRASLCVQMASILPDDTSYYDVPLDYWPGMDRSLRMTLREHWLSDALKATVGAGLVFLDPDNGSTPHDNKKYRKEGPKFVYVDDAKAFWDRGQSLVIYHHLGMMKPAEEMINDTADILKSTLCIEPIPMRFRRGTSRVFFVVPQPRHERSILERLERMLDSPWNLHFKRT